MIDFDAKNSDNFIKLLTDQEPIPKATLTPRLDSRPKMEEESKH